MINTKNSNNTDSILENKSKLFKFNQSAFKNKMSRDLVALSYFENEFKGVSSNLETIYENLKGIGEELNIPISESLFKLSFGKETRENITSKMKSILRADLTNNFIIPFNNNKLENIHESEIKILVENAITSNVNVEGDAITYAIFESVVADFLKTVVFGRHGEDLIHETIETTNKEYFDTFENNFKDKFSTIQEHCQIVAEKIAPTLYGRVSAVTGSKPNDVVVGLSRKLH